MLVGTLCLITQKLLVIISITILEANKFPKNLSAKQFTVDKL